MVWTKRKICKADLPKNSNRLIASFNYHLRLSTMLRLSVKNQYLQVVQNQIHIEVFHFSYFPTLMPLLTLAKHVRVFCHPFTALRCESDF